MVYLLESSEAVVAAGMRRIPAILLQVPDGGGRRGIAGPGRHVKGSGADERADLVEPNPAETEYRVAAGVRLRQPDVPAHQRRLERVHALLGVVGHHGLVVAVG